MAGAETRAVGGQAVLEGVMMRGESTWAVAVRTPDGDVELDVREVAGWADRYRAVPILRGVTSLGESLSLGYRALTWSANRQIPEDEQVPERAMGWTMGISVALFSALFLVLPALAIRGASDRYSFLPFHLTEGVFRLLLFVGYLLLISLMRDIRRVFQYHGAEHKTIAAFENGVELTPDVAQQFTTAHVRCGTNFLLTVMVVAIVTYSFVPTRDLWVVIGSRIVLIPVIAGLSYEVIRFAAGHLDRAWVRAAMRPGLALQRLTTREPDLDQLEVAIASLRAVLTDAQRAEVDARAGTRVPVRPALDMTP